MARGINIKFPTSSPYVLQASTGKIWTASGIPTFQSTAPPPTAFDFYISTGGNDANPGTFSQPWAITAVNTKQSTYSGKRVGLIAGTYNVQALMAANGSGAGNYVKVALQTNGSSNPASPTTFASCDTSGNYSARAATITAKVGSVYGNPNNNNGSGNARAGNCIMGWRQQGGTPPLPNNIVLDGIVFTGNCAVNVQFGDVAATPPTGIVVQNCEFSDNSGIGTEAGNNLTFVTSVGNGIVWQNCYFHDYVGYAVGSADHLSAILLWNPSTGTIIRNCTATNCGPFFGKTQTAANPDIEGTLVELNYGDSSMFTTGLIAGCEDFANSKTATTTIRGNIFLGSQAMACYQDEGSLATTGPLEHYNNTVIVTGTSGNDKCGISSRCTGIYRSYNNIIQFNTAAGGQSEGYLLLTTGAGLAMNYNVYCKNLQGSDKWTTWSASGTGGTGFTTLASWRATTGQDANSTTAATASFTGSGTSAQQYQLQGGSVAQNFGHIGGVSGGTVVDAGAWGWAHNVGSIVGCSFGP